MLNKAFGGFDGAVGVSVAVSAVLICTAILFLFHAILKVFSETLKSRMIKVLVNRFRYLLLISLQLYIVINVRF